MVSFWASFARKSWHTSPNFILILFTSSLYLYMIWSYNLCRHIKGTFEFLHKQHFAYYLNFRCRIMSEHVIIFFLFSKNLKTKEKEKKSWMKFSNESILIALDHVMSGQLSSYLHTVSIKIYFFKNMCKTVFTF